MKPRRIRRNLQRTITWLIRAATIVVWATFAASAPVAAQQSTPDDRLPVLKIGYPVWVGYGPLFLAQEKGFFKQEGVLVELVKMEDPRLRYGALAAGRLDIVAIGLPVVPLNHKPEMPIKCFLPIDESVGADGIVALKAISRPQDLKGKTVAYHQGGLTEYYLSYVLARAGLNLSDVKGANLQPDDAASAFFAGRVDAAVTWEPWLTKAKSAEHGHVLHNTQAAPGAITDCLAATGGVLEKRRIALQAVVRAWYRAVEYFKGSPDESIKIMARKVGGWLEKPEEFSSALAGARFFDRNDAIRYFSGVDAPGKKAMREAMNLWVRAGKASKDLTTADLVDDSFVQ